jgi:cell wall assembly regulator SMI1
VSEGALCYTHPEDVKSSLKIHNGTVNCFIGIWDFLSLEGILKQQHIQIDVLRAFQEWYDDAESEEKWWCGAPAGFLC